MFFVLQYDGPPCREHCGFYGPFKVYMSFPNLENYVSFLLQQITCNSEWDNIIISKTENISDAVFSYAWLDTCGKNSFLEYPWLETVLQQSRFEAFLLNSTWSEETCSLIEQNIEQIRIKMQSYDNDSD